MATETETEYIRDSCLDNEEMRKIFVSGIPSESKDEELKSFFEGICSGTVSEVAVIRKDSDKKTHFGFVTFETSELIDEVLLQRASLKFNGKDLEVNRAVPKNIKSAGAHERTKKLFIANLPKTCTEDELREYFEKRHQKKYGTIESIQLIKKKGDDGGKTEENKGFGFVMVSSEDMADKMSIQHASFQFGGRKIELKKSVPTADGAGGGRGRGRGAGGRGAGRGGAGQFGQAYGGYDAGYGGYGGYGGDWGYGGYGYDAYGYGQGGYPPFGAGYGQAGAPGPRGRGRGGQRGRAKPY